MNAEHDACGGEQVVLRGVFRALHHVLVSGVRREEHREAEPAEANVAASALHRRAAVWGGVQGQYAVQIGALEGETVRDDLGDLLLLLLLVVAAVAIVAVR